jgi:hypothetical protein
MNPSDNDAWRKAAPFVALGAGALLVATLAWGDSPSDSRSTISARKAKLTYLAGRPRRA